MKKSESTNEMVNEVASEIMNEMENEAVTKVSYGEMCKPSSMSKSINCSPALEEEYEKVFGEEYSDSALSSLIYSLDKDKVRNVFRAKKGIFTNDYFFNIILEKSVTKRNHIEKKSTRLSRSDWEFIDSVMTKTANDKTVTRKKSNFIFFLAFLIYYEKNKNTNNKIVPIEKTDMEDFSRPIFHLIGNKKWFKDKFYSMFEQLLAEKDIKITLDLFGGSGVLTGYMQDYCYKNGITLRSIYNDLDDEKINFFKQLKASPQELENKCRKLLETYDYYKSKGKENSILQLKKDAEVLKKEKGLHGAAAFWYVQTTNKKGEVNLKKRKALEEFTYASKLYKELELKKTDALYRLNEWLESDESFNNENAFLIVDSPYCNTRGYKRKWANDEFNRASQDKLCEILLNTKATWIYHGRIKAPRDYCKRQGEQELIEKDIQCRVFFDNNFQNKGVFYLDVPLSCVNTVERIVSNYQFDGFKPYVEEPYSSFLDDTDEEVIVSSVESADEEMIVPSVENAVEKMVASSVEDIKEEMTVPSTENTDEEITTSSVENVVEEMTISPVENADEKANISPSVEDTGKEVTISSIETATEETTIETPVHTEPSSVEEIVTDTHIPVVEEKRKKERKGVFGKLLDFFQSF